MSEGHPRERGLAGLHYAARSGSENYAPESESSFHGSTLALSRPPLGQLRLHRTYGYPVARLRRELREVHRAATDRSPPSRPKLRERRNAHTPARAEFWMRSHP